MMHLCDIILLTDTLRRHQFLKDVINQSLVIDRELGTELGTEVVKSLGEPHTVTWGKIYQLYRGQRVNPLSIS